jgi:hypothetical protein
MFTRGPIANEETRMRPVRELEPYLDGMPRNHDFDLHHVKLRRVGSENRQPGGQAHE